MIGWKPKPFIFVHIPKCAGTSIEKALIPIVSDYTDFKDFCEKERTKFWLPGNKGLQHSKIRRYGQCFNLNEYFKFTFVRNPWDRAISQILYLRAKNGSSTFSGNNFKNHLKIYCSSNKNVQGHDLGACQLDYLLDDSGKLSVDFVAKFESLLPDFKTICSNLNINTIPYLPHIFNSFRNRHYSTYYDMESKEWIRVRFAKDIEFFGYSFESQAETETLCNQNYKEAL